MPRTQPRARWTCSRLVTLSLVAIVTGASGCVLDGWQPPVDACVGPRCGGDATLEGGVASCEGRPALGIACANGGFACAIRCDGSVWCWGANASGQLGDGTTETRATPTRVASLPGRATGISAGYNHVCAVLESGGVYCWGQNQWGELGDGTRVSRSIPVMVARLPARGTAVAAGGAHTCAIVEDGGVWCWGQNLHGGLGDGTMTDNVRPALVSLSERAVQLVAGQYHTCARLESGLAQCWGFNGFGALGDGSTTTRLSATDVALADNARSIMTAANHGCAALSSGVAQCWGYNVLGGLGDGSRSMRRIPVNVRGLPSAAQSMATGGRHSCAQLEGGALYCWGANDRGQLGDGSTVSTAMAAVAVATGASVVHSSASDTTTCAALSDGRVQCWGANAEGQLGDGTFDQRVTPTTTLLPP